MRQRASPQMRILLCQRNRQTACVTKSHVFSRVTHALQQQSSPHRIERAEKRAQVLNLPIRAKQVKVARALKPTLWGTKTLGVRDFTNNHKRARVLLGPADNAPLPDLSSSFPYPYTFFAEHPAMEHEGRSSFFFFCILHPLFCSFRLKGAKRRDKTLGTPNPLIYSMITKILDPCFDS